MWNKSDNPVCNQEAFERFQRQLIKRTNRIGMTDELFELLKNFDSVIVGSDQVRRTSFAIDPVAFFLGYMPEGVYRISYAASFGTNVWELLRQKGLVGVFHKSLEN